MSRPRLYFKYVFVYRIVSTIISLHIYSQACDATVR